ncbi:MAG: hypothetical protein Q8K63_02525 [Acidimicrobiales bacterium]|nr:hypothetical protein [Acidimicrobiales bacterium]
MRIRFAAVAAIALVAPFAPAAPAGSLSPPPPDLQFRVTPVAGPSGTQITVTGYCTAGTTVNLSLKFPMRSDALFPPIDETTAQVDQNNEFTATLSNDIVSTQQFPGEDPVDLEVGASCGNLFRDQPFASTQRTTTDNPLLFTGLGQGACGQAFGPPQSDLAIPCPVHVKGTNAAGGIKNVNFYGFGDRGGRGANVAAGFIDGDGVADVVVASNPDQATVGVYYAGNPSSFTSFTPFGSFAGQVNVAVGDVIGDSAKEIISAAGPGGGPHVVVTNTDGTVLASFFAYGLSFTGGVTVAAADVDGDGKDEIVTGAGPGGGPHVRVFEGNGAASGPGFYAYGAGFTGGVNVAAGNVTGDDKAEIVTGTQGGGGPHVALFTADGTKPGPGFYAYDSAFSGGVSVAVGNTDAAAGNEIVTAPFRDGDPHVRVFTTITGGSTSPGFYAYSRIPAGVRVAVAR